MSFSDGALIMTGSAMPASDCNTQIFSIRAITMLGGGLFRLNISAIVGRLYPRISSRREVAAGVLFDLVQPVVARHHFGESGLIPESVATSDSWARVVIVVWPIVLLALLALDASLQFDPSVAGVAATWMFSTLALGYFGPSRLFAGLKGDERRRVYVMLALFIGRAILWAGYEQMGASFNLFADRYSDRQAFGLEIPAGALQRMNPIFIVVFAPMLAAVWLNLGRRDRGCRHQPGYHPARVQLTGGGFSGMA